MTVSKRPLKLYPCVKCGKDFPKLRCDNCGSYDMKTDWADFSELGYCPEKGWSCLRCDQWEDTLLCGDCGTRNSAELIGDHGDGGCLVELWRMGGLILAFYLYFSER